MERNNIDRGQFSREARSSTNTRINNIVQPQTKVRASSVEGRWVKIIDGPYSGSSGRIESCIPGNWYLVSQLSKKNKYDLDYVVHARCLEMIQSPVKHSPNTQDTLFSREEASNEESKEIDQTLTLPLM